MKIMIYDVEHRPMVRKKEPCKTCKVSPIRRFCPLSPGIQEKLLGGGRVGGVRRVDLTNG
jgi:hypothetical protein